jgi:SAM-dependent MidA family methyltransferase
VTDTSNGLIALIREKGRISFAEFQALALYHAELGYYTSGRERSGWGGHYITSAQLDPAFGELWARGLEEIWRASGAPNRFFVVELGPGEGAFAASVLRGASSDLRSALSYVLVERSDVLRARQAVLLHGEADVSWASGLSEMTPHAAGCIIANEVLDNQPVHIVEQQGGSLVELNVEEQAGGLQGTWLPATPPLIDFLTRNGMERPEGRIEVHLAAEQLVRSAAAAIQTGALVFLDYGAEALELLSKPEGTLVCYSGQGVDDDPLDRPGEKDITSHANWTSVRAAVTAAGLEPSGPVPQREVLISLGLRDLMQAAKEEQERALQAGRGAEGFRAIARRQALATLAEPAGLGGMDVFAALKGIEAPPFLR